jgi:parvulin-like peptidyl-prolyl isomerase
VKLTLKATSVLSAALIAPTLLAGGTAAAAEPAPTHPVIDRLVVIVNSEPVTQFEMRRAAAPFVAKAVTESRSKEELDTKIEQIEREVLENLTNDLLVYGEAKKLSLTVDPQRVTDRLDRIRDANKWTEEQFAEQLRRLGYASISDYRRHTEREMLKSQAISAKVSSQIKIDESEVQEELKKQISATNTVEERSAAHILLRVDQPADEETARAFLVELRASIVAGTVSFGEAARQHSQDTNKDAGGDLGWFTRGDYNPEFEDAAFGLGEDVLSEPIRTPYGYHLIKINGVRERQIEGEKNIESLRKAIQYRIQQRELERIYLQWVKGLRSQAFTTIKDPKFIVPPAVPLG